VVDELEWMVKECGLIYVKFDGNVGIFGNGVGFVMLILDVVV